MEEGAEIREDIGNSMDESQHAMRLAPGLDENLGFDERNIGVGDEGFEHLCCRRR